MYYGFSYHMYVFLFERTFLVIHCEPATNLDRFLDCIKPSVLVHYFFLGTSLILSFFFCAFH